jgi:hypothetical protein
MDKYWNRLIYRNTEDRFPLWLYLTLAYTLSNGMAFTFFGHSKSVSASVLFQLTSNFGGSHFVSLWGLLAIAAVVLTILNLLVRYRPISGLGPTIGYLVWLYATLVYLTHGYLFQMVPAVIQLAFWLHHHMRLLNYRHNVDAGIETPPN